MQYSFKKPKRHVHTIFLHCSATDNPQHDNLEFIKRVHVDENRWADIGYHFFINKRGDLFTARSLEKSPAAQRGHNTGTIAICVSGLQEFTDSQFYMLGELLEKIQAKYATRLRIRGHKEVAARDCPVFDYPKVLDLVNEGSEAQPEYYLRPERITETAEVKGLTVAAGAGTLAVAEELAKSADLVSVASQVQAGTTIASSLSMILNYGPIVLGVIALIALGYVFWKFKDRVGL